MAIDGSRLREDKTSVWHGLGIGANLHEMIPSLRGMRFSWRGESWHPNLVQKGGKTCAPRADLRDHGFSCLLEPCIAAWQSCCLAAQPQPRESPPPTA